MIQDNMTAIQAAVKQDLGSGPFEIILSDVRFVSYILRDGFGRPELCSIHTDTALVKARSNPQRDRVGGQAAVLVDEGRDKVVGCDAGVQVHE